MLNEVQMSFPPEYPDINHLINQEIHTDLFGQALRKIQRGREPSYKFFEWFGGPGIGKSQLIRLLVNKHCINTPVSFVLTSFNDRYTEISLLCHIANNLKISNLDELEKSIEAYQASSSFQNPSRQSTTLTQYQRLHDQPEWLRLYEAMSKSFVATLMQSAELSHPIVLFFDKTENIDPEFTEWLEAYIFAPLLQHKSFVIVWTGRSPFRWKHSDVKRRFHSQRLTPFILDDVRKQFKTRQLDTLADDFFNQTLFRDTDGHPSAGAVVMAQLSHWQDTEEKISTSFLHNRQQELLTKIYTVFIQNYAFSDLREDEKIACDLLALVRSFDVLMLQTILQKHGGSEFKQWTLAQFRDLFKRLENTPLLIWEAEKRILDPHLRHIIRSYFLSCEPDIFIAINKTAQNTYQDWLERPKVHNPNLFITEYLYHLASLRSIGQPVNITDLFYNQLHLYQEQFDEDSRIQTLDSLNGRINNDTILLTLLGDTSTDITRSIQRTLDATPEDRNLFIQLTKLRELLKDSFHDTEFNILCYDLGIDYENLPNHSLSAKGLALVRQMKRENRLQELTAYCREKRPHATWPVFS